MQIQVASSEAKRPARVIDTSDTTQDKLLREVVRVMEQAQRESKWTWSWLAEESELTASAYYGWRKGKTKGVFLRRINSVLKPLGYRLYIGKLK